jgi:cell division protein FtsB
LASLAPRLAVTALAVLLALVHAELWFGNSGLPRVVELSDRLARQQAKNADARAGNTALLAELDDLKGGLEMVEEKARSELGMIKPDEIFVHVSSGISSATPAGVAAGTAPAAAPKR